MKFSRYLILAAAVLLLSGAAMADAIDPAIGVKGGTGSSPWGSEGNPNQVIFGINNTTATCVGGTCDFTSGVFFSNFDITTFDFLFSQSQNTGFSLAGGSVFTILNIISGVDTANPEAILSGGLIVPPCFECLSLLNTSSALTEFRLVMNGVVEGSNVTVTSNVPIPEPGTVILLVSGLGAIGLRRLRRRKKAASSAL